MTEYTQSSRVFHAQPPVHWFLTNPRASNLIRTSLEYNDPYAHMLQIQFTHKGIPGTFLEKTSQLIPQLLKLLKWVSDDGNRLL